MKDLIRRCLSIVGFKPKKYIQSCFDYDAEIYSSYSGLYDDGKPVIAAKMRIICHTIEKALSLSDCRADFGTQKIKELICLYNSYIKADLSPDDQNTLDVVRSTVHSYIRHRENHNLDTSFIPHELHDSTSDIIKCGANRFTSSVNDFKDFAHIAESRHSIRNYSSRPVSREDIVSAVRIAQTAPSACNRQATKVYAITEASKINAIKQRHGGIRTFGNPGVIFAITQDLKLYLNEYERNTWLVDGGIFCMNLLYALNSVGIVNCPVIWGGMKDEDAFISELIGIPHDERIVILIVGGYAPDEGVKTPCSPKRRTNNILRLIEE